MSKLKKRMLVKRLVYILYNIVVLFVAYLFNRFFQMLIFILFFNAIQGCFGYRFHSDTLYPNDPIKAVKLCKAITIAVEVVYLAFCKELDVSVYSNLFIILLVAIMNALLQVYCERVIISHHTLNNKDYIMKAVRGAHLSSLAINRLIEHYVNNKTIQEIAYLENVEEQTIKQSIRRSKRRLEL